MPSGYCNDDYYHGILRSKSGVYESYLKIASVARERKNFEMEKRFLQYAQDYLNENPEIAHQGKSQPSEQLSYSTPEPKPFFNTSVSPGEITVTAVNPPIQTLPNPVVEENRSQSQPNTHTAAPAAPQVREGIKEETATVLAAPNIFNSKRRKKRKSKGRKYPKRNNSNSG